jgi:hypothetical protein
MPPNKKFSIDFSTGLDELKASRIADRAQPEHARPLTTANSDDAETLLHDIEVACDCGVHEESEAQSTDQADFENVTAPDSDKSSSKAEEDEHHRKRVRKLIRNLSSLVKDPEQISIDEKRLFGAVRDAGKYAYGIQGVTVWLFDEDHDRLGQPSGGWWHDPSMPASEALDRLTDSSHPDHVPPNRVAPGVDMPGILWLESNNRKRVGSFTRRASSTKALVRDLSNISLSNFDGGVGSDPNGDLVWRNLRSLVQDPDTAQGPRLSLLEEAGFGQATGITFHTGVNKGIVIFFAKESADEEVLHNMANVTYLRQAAHFIGAASAMSESRRASIAHKLEASKSLAAHENVIKEKHEQGRLEETQRIFSDEPTTQACRCQVPQACRCQVPQACRCQVPHRLRVWTTKIQGGGSQIPPPLSYRQSLWTVFGAFCSLLVLSALNEYYQYLSDGNYELLIGPFGALMTLQYGLTAAPASQPRNAIMGQAVAGAVSLSFTYIPETILALWLRRAVGPAVAIGVMVKCGFTHPPAGAHAVVYASGDYTFAFYALVVFSTAVSVIPATVVNNMSIKRQYPTYWGFIPDPIHKRVHELLFGGIKRETKVKK